MNIHFSPNRIEKGAMIAPVHAVADVASALAGTAPTGRAFAAFRQVAGMTKPTDRVSASAIVISRTIVAQADEIRAQSAPAAPPAPAPAPLTPRQIEHRRKLAIARNRYFLRIA